MAQRPPSVPIVVRRERDVSQHASPFDQSPLDVAGADGISEQFCAGCVVLDKFADELGGTGTVFGRDTHREVIFKVCALIHGLAKRAEPARERGFITGETRSRTEVREVEYKVRNGISGFLQRRCNREAFAVMKEAENRAASCRRAIRLDEPEASPGPCGRLGDFRALAPRKFIASRAACRKRAGLRNVSANSAIACACGSSIR